ncbi:MAG: hypothetical protein ACYC6Y_07895 [Thermoguttaceae bacterium]
MKKRFRHKLEKTATCLRGTTKLLRSFPVKSEEAIEHLARSSVFQVDVPAVSDGAEDSSPPTFPLKGAKKLNDPVASANRPGKGLVMSVERFVESIVKETLARMGDRSASAVRKSVLGESGRRWAVEFGTPHTTAVWLPNRDVVIFHEKNGRCVRILNVGETMRARGIAA